MLYSEIKETVAIVVRCMKEVASTMPEEELRYVLHGKQKQESVEIFKKAA